jgi:muconate cycloisomerase
LHPCLCGIGRRADDLATQPLHFGDFQVHLPAGPGIGVTLHPDKLRRHARK